MRRHTAALFVALIATAGACTVVDRYVDGIETGMSMEAVSRAVGDPDGTKPALINRYGQKVEVWEYTRRRGDDDPYLFYFVGGKLAIWGTSPNWHDLANQLAEPPK